MDIIDKILDDENDDDIEIEDEVTGETKVFEQIAVIPYSGIYYPILSPKESDDIFEAGEGIVFKIIEENNERILMIEEDDEIVNKIFDIYDELYEKEFGGAVYEDETGKKNK